MKEKYTAYDALGEERLSEVVDCFYGHVSEHPDLKSIFPDDLTETRRKQKQFLTQFFGGPPLYTEEHGHPMLRARHMPFVITPKRAEAWLSCMAQALTEKEIEEPLRSAMFERLSYTAKHMVNTTDSAPRGDQS
ncbi:protoglobin domain-containing protein [Alkalicoccus daliensis]|uniref:Hemoglobin n=1 Tax=Alkalicoccus daliensis TaxID=745820 RepID=A0A1G9ZGH0_9BACI|nr:protoglobin domain-containing protein [Alkalicoccus daliensis]SDN20207.1 hemoglobin [Alkalicoccus daliensis]